MPFTAQDIFNPISLTDLIELRAQEPVTYDIDGLAPLVDTNDTEAEFLISAGTQARIGQFRAVNSLTPISQPPAFNLVRRRIPLPILAEKEALDEHTLRLVNSADTDLALQAANTIVDDGVRLREQNINLSKWMVFRALQDGLGVAYATGGSVDVQFLMNNSDGAMSASHLPSAAVLWTNPAATIRDDTQAWSDVIAADFGGAATDMWVPRPVFRAMQKNTEMMKLTGSAADPRTPTQTQIQDMLGLQSLVVYDGKYKDQANVTQPFMPVNKIFLFARGNARNRPIVLLNGPVAIYDPGTSRIRVAPNAGARAEIWAEADPPKEFIRIQTCRMPRIVREGVITATVA